ncbi:MAG: Nramp family divalent metal transporter [Candidatus Acidiferrales bacterium]
MDWVKLKSRMEAWSSSRNVWYRRSRVLKRRILLLLLVFGPGVITSNVDNDAGGIGVYSSAGAKYGYALLWALIPMTIALYVTEEMCARLGVVTGKGLSDLIREEFGFRPTFFVVVMGFLVDMCNVVAEFVGVAQASVIFHISPYISVPIFAFLIWILVLLGTYRVVEIVFLFAVALYGVYGISAFMAHPDWLMAAKSTVIPSFQMNAPYLLMLTALIGTTIAPWQFFYMQASFVEKRVGPKQYKQARLDVLIGTITCMIVVFFIIVCTAATLHKSGQLEIADAGQAAKALLPLAGKWAAYVFAFGLFNASIFAASVLPLSTAHVVCEGLGFEAGIDHKFSEAPIFYWLYTVLIAVGAGIVLIPHVNTYKILVYSQVANGIWLPVVVIFLVLLANRRDLLGDRVNSKTFNVIAWTTSILMIILTIILVFASIFPNKLGGVPGM